METSRGPDPGLRGKDTRPAGATAAPPIEKVGRSALIIAYWRSREIERPEPLHHDHLANIFLDPATEQAAADITALSPSTEHLVNFRIRFCDDFLSQSLADGVRQIVLLGSGLDTRAIRNNTPGARFYEIDLPDVLTFKRDRLDTYGYHTPSAMIPCDYTREDWLLLASREGLDPAAPTCIIWEGNSMYVERTAITHLLETIRDTLTQFTMTFDYISQRLLEGRATIPQARHIANQFAGIQAPWTTGFDVVQPFIAGLGLHLNTDQLLAELAHSYRPDLPLDTRLLDDYRICTISKTTTESA